MNSTDNHYTTLGVAKNASQDVIKKAFRKLSLKYHPDKYDGTSPVKNVNLRYQKILKAYEIIGDTDKRNVYDQFGDNPPPNFGGASMGGGNPFDIFNIFNQSPFSNGGNGGNRSRGKRCSDMLKFV